LAERKFIAQGFDKVHLSGKLVAVHNHLAHEVHEVIEPLDIDPDELFLDIGGIRGSPADAALLHDTGPLGIFELLLERRFCGRFNGRGISSRLFCRQTRWYGGRHRGR
jgi:hypothetical protein